MMPSLDLTTLDKRLEELKKHYQNLRTIQVENLKYWDGTFESDVPIPADKGIITVTPQTGRNAIDIPASHIVTDKPVVKRRRETHSDAQHKDDDAIEAFDLAFLLDNEENALTPPRIIT